MAKTRILVLIGSGLFMLLLFFTATFLPAKLPVLENSAKAAEKLAVKDKKKMTSVQWQGTLFRDLETHYYLFSTKKKGKIDVTWGLNTNGSNFIVTDKSWSTTFYNGDVLPAGEYMFVITSEPAESPDDPVLLNYQFTLRGLTFTEAPNTTLPNLTIDTPNDLVSHLPVGSQTIQFKGHTDTGSVVFGTSGMDGVEVLETLNSPFEKVIYYNEQSPFYNNYRITVTNKAGNSVNRYFEVYYIGGIQE